MGRTIQELESLLDEERRKYLLLEDRYDGLLREYDSERRLRIDFDHDIGSLKEELRKKDIVLSDLDLQLSRLQQENTYLNTENNSLRSEIARLNDMYHLKINEIEERNTN
jgi:chromosome segregation ATPase